AEARDSLAAISRLADAELGGELEAVVDADDRAHVLDEVIEPSTLGAVGREQGPLAERVGQQGAREAGDLAAQHAAIDPLAVLGQQQATGHAAERLGELELADPQAASPQRDALGAAVAGDLQAPDRE